MDRKKIFTTLRLLLPLPFIGCGTKPEAEAPKEETPKKDKLTFAFLTDVHLSRDNSRRGQRRAGQALEDTKARQADFLLFGGDNVETDHMKKGRGRRGRRVARPFQENRRRERAGVPLHDRQPRPLLF